MSIYGNDGYLQKRSISQIERSELEGMGTRQLLARLNGLRKCIDTLSDTEYDEEDASSVQGIVFKDTPEWTRAHADVKEILDTREHVPNRAERAERRRARAERARTG